MKTSRHKITFEATADARVIALARLGQTNDSIARNVGMTDGQINYRIHKEKVYMHRATGLRAEWRNGTSPIFAQIRADVEGVIVADVMQSLPVKILARDEQEASKTGGHSRPAAPRGRKQGR